MCLVKWASLLVLGFLSLYLGGKSKKTHSDGREIAWLQRLGSCERFHEERETRLAAYFHAFEHSTLRSFFKPRRRRKATSAEEEALLSDDEIIEEVVSSSGARVGELERLIAEKRLGGGWFEPGVEEVLAPMGSRNVNSSELAAWVALPDAMERLREMLVCSEVGSDAASHTAEAIGMLSSQRRSLRMAVYETGLTEALIARLRSTGTARVSTAWALLHATSTWTTEEAMATEAKRKDEALKLGAHVDSLLEMAFGAKPATFGVEYHKTSSFIAIELLVHASRENARQILTALRQRGVDARLRQIIMTMDPEGNSMQQGALARLVAQMAYEVHEPFRLKKHDDALLLDLHWLAGWSAEGLSAVALKPRRSRYCAAASALKVLAAYPSATGVVAYHALGDNDTAKWGQDTGWTVDSRLETATSSHLTDAVFHRLVLPPFRADLIDVLYVVENGLGLELWAIVEVYTNLPTVLKAMVQAARSMMAPTNQTVVEPPPREEEEDPRQVLPEEEPEAEATQQPQMPSNFAALLTELEYRRSDFFWMALKIAMIILLMRLGGRFLDFLTEIAAICILDGAVRNAILVLCALKSWLTGGLPVDLQGATAFLLFVVGMLPLGGLIAASMCLTALPLFALPHAVVTGLLMEQCTLTEVGRRCFAIVHAGVLISFSFVLLALAAPMVGFAILVTLLAVRRLADVLLLVPFCSLPAARVMCQATSFLFVAVLGLCSPLNDAASRRVAFYHLKEALNPAMRASASALRWLRRKPVKLQPPTEGDACLICHETFGEEQKEDFKEFPPPLAFCRWGCGRPFHAECVAAWRQKQNVCALCGAGWS